MARVDIFNEEGQGDFYKKFSNRMVNVALVGANQVRRHMGDNFSREAWMQTMFEFVYFYIALSRDHALAESQSERRERVVDKLSNLIIPALVDYLFEDIRRDENESFKTYYLAELTQRLQRYEKCKTALPGEGGEKLERTSLGVFCQGVSELAGNKGDMAVIMLCHSHVMDSIDVLNFDLFAAMA